MKFDLNRRRIVNCVWVQEKDKVGVKTQINIREERQNLARSWLYLLDWKRSRRRKGYI